MTMATCAMCEEQSKKTRNGKPHEYLGKADTPRLFKGARSRGFEEQDYECRVCQAKFTHSTNKNDLAWTLWQG
jgi:hypothetical protein